MSKSKSQVLFDQVSHRGFLNLDLSLALPAAFDDNFDAQTYFVGYYVGSSFRVLRQFPCSKCAHEFIRSRSFHHGNYLLHAFGVSLSLMKVY